MGGGTDKPEQTTIPPRPSEREIDGLGDNKEVFDAEVFAVC